MDLQPQTGSPLNVEWKRPSQSSFVFKKMHIWLLSHDLTRPNCPHENSIYIHFYYFACVSVSVGSWIFHFYFKSMVCGLLTLRWTDVFFPLVLFLLLGVVFESNSKTLSLMPTFYFYLLIFTCSRFFFLHRERPKKKITFHPPKKCPLKRFFGSLCLCLEPPVTFIGSLQIAFLCV